MTGSGNRLGEIRAEADVEMLDRAFLETADYRTLIESPDKQVVVGRRGTGKSALAYRLQSYWNAQDRAIFIRIAPQEDQVIALRPLLERLGDNYNHIRAAVKISWSALLALEILSRLVSHYKFERASAAQYLRSILHDSIVPNRNMAYNLRRLMDRSLPASERPETSIGELAERLQVSTLENGLCEVLDATKKNIFIVIDRLDEGYTPDLIGMGYVGGIIHGTLHLNAFAKGVRSVLFIRDNMFRAVAAKDPDYSRNIEGSCLRLHWDEPQLLNLAAKRIRYAFEIKQENDIRVWNQVAAKGLSDREGFRKCLRLTLYRPRDLLALLNEAFFSGARNGRVQIIDDDVEVSAKDISRTRLEDLQKEYAVVFPSIKVVTMAFANQKAELSGAEAEAIIGEKLGQDVYDFRVQQDLEMFGDPKETIRGLYGVGFIGIKDSASGSFVFCHDGRSPDLGLQPDTSLLVHPCYQVALNSIVNWSDEGAAQEIHDDYEIEIVSISQEQRNKKVGRLISALANIPVGREGASEFEEWCLQAVRMAFAGALRNIELHPNKNSSTQRRDIVATNPATDDFWRRLLHDYGTRQIIFEVKNYSDLETNDYRQLATYLVDSYGRLGFFITRSDVKDPHRDKDLAWIREIYWKSEPKKLLVPLSYKWLTGFLEKIRNPQKHDAVNKALHKLIDTYIRVYLNEMVRAAAK